MIKYYLKRYTHKEEFKVSARHCSCYTLYNNDPSRNHPLEYLKVPCKSRLHYCLTGLFFDWDWKKKGPIEITEEEAMMLKHIFSSQTEYKLWKDTLKKIKEVGENKAKKWLIEQVKVLALRNIIRG